MWKRAIGLLVLMAVGYFVGVGGAAVFGEEEPWIFGMVGVGPILGTYFGEKLLGRSRST